MQTKENLSQTVKDVKVEIIKDVVKKENTANTVSCPPRGAEHVIHSYFLFSSSFVPLTTFQYLVL